MVLFGKSTDKSRCSPVDPLQALNPDPRKTNEYRGTIVEAAQHECMNAGNCGFERQGASNDPELPQLIIAAAAHLIYMRGKGEL